MVKIGWGRGLVIFFILYISYLVVTVIKSTQVHHSLVIEDYYQHDIDYQKMYVAPIENRNTLASDLFIKVNAEDQLVNLDFGTLTHRLKGEILFYRPSDKSLDRRIDFNLKPEEQHIDVPTNDLLNGRWTIKVRWEDDSMNYYKEEDIVI